MNLICSDEKLVARFKGKNSLLDAVVTKIEIYDSNSFVNVEINFTMRSSSEFRDVMLQFRECKEYGFYYNDIHHFYNVERVKLFKNDNDMFYISMDPFDEKNIISDNDQDFILANHISAYSI